MPIARTIILGTAFNGSATFDNEGLRDKGSVNYKTRRSSEHEGICGEDLSFFDRNDCIGTNMQICTHITAAEGDRILSVAFNKGGSEVKAERVMRNDEQSHDPSGFKLLEDNRALFSRRQEKQSRLRVFSATTATSPSFFRISGRQISPASAK